jgi:hypothetical protein
MFSANLFAFIKDKKEVLEANESRPQWAYFFGMAN